MKSGTIYSITFNTLPIAIVLPARRKRKMNSQSATEPHNANIVR
jgi:hypothetical protein